MLLQPVLGMRYVEYHKYGQ